jgi:hypothetical protein
MFDQLVKMMVESDLQQASENPEAMIVSTA